MKRKKSDTSRVSKGGRKKNGYAAWWKRKFQGGKGAGLRHGERGKKGWGFDGREGGKKERKKKRLNLGQTGQEKDRQSR